jgi:alpha-beta hydrolase superfamily lysophospholipase
MVEESARRAEGWPEQPTRKEPAPTEVRNRDVKKVRSIIVTASGALAAWLVLCGVIGVVAVEGALHPARLPLSPEDQSGVATLAGESGARSSEAQITAQDGAQLRAWSIRPRSWNGDAVILLHGQGDNRTGMLGVAQMLLRHRYAVLLPDARAHGLSGGNLATYGVLETQDVQRWFEWLRTEEAPRCIDGLGDSMGAAELLESLTTEKQFCAVVAESPFATFKEAAYDRLGQHLSTGPWAGRTLLLPAVYVGIAYAWWRYGIDLRQADPQASVALTRVPVLLIHGLADTNLPPRHSEMMMKAGNPAVALWEPANADHCGAMATAPAEFERRVTAWFDSHDHN